MIDWTTLPPEIQDAILSILDADARGKKSRPHPRTDYATVCRKWQFFFQHTTFRQLILSRACLKDLDTMVRPGKRRMVKHVWLRVELPLYHCGLCRTAETSLQADGNNMVFAAALAHLFAILSKWDADGAGGITLELSMHLPSDSWHFFRDRSFDAFRFTGEDCLDDMNEDDARQFLARRRVQVDDEYHGWRNGHQAPRASWPLPDTSLPLARLFGRPLQIRDVELPQVDVVTGFLMRRQYFRSLDKSALDRILESLPRLEHLHYELRLKVVEYFQHSVDAGYLKVFSRLIFPGALKCMSLFEDSDDFFNNHGTYRPPRPRNERLGHLLAEESLDLEELSLAFLVDARDFLRQFWPDMQSALAHLPDWTNLTNLALTSALLSPKANEDDANNLLQEAGRAATKMPKLSVLEIWNGEKGGAAVFRYEIRYESAQGTTGREADVRGGDYSAVLTWSSSWEFCLQLRVVGTWAQVADSKRRELVVHREKMAAPAISYGPVLGGLKLRRLILHPVSQYQIEREAETD